MCITSGVLGTLQRWEPQIWPCSTLLHTVSCCLRKSPSPRFPVWGMRNLVSPLSTHKDPHTVRSSENLHCSGSLPTWRVGLYSLYLPNLPTASCIWMTWANCNLMTTICLDHLLYTVLVTVSLPLPGKQFSAGPSISYVQGVQSGRKTDIKLYLHDCFFFFKKKPKPRKMCLLQESISSFPFPHSMLCSCNTGMSQRGKLPWYQRCPGLR